VSSGCHNRIVQKEEVFLYKSYDVSSKASTSDTRIMQEEVNNLEKALQILQAPTKTTMFFPPEHYKTIYQEGEMNSPY